MSERIPLTKEVTKEVSNGYPATIEAVWDELEYHLQTDTEPSLRAWKEAWKGLMNFLKNYADIIDKAHMRLLSPDHAFHGEYTLRRVKRLCWEKLIAEWLETMLEGYVDSSSEDDEDHEDDDDETEVAV